MNTQQAVVDRIFELCNENNMTWNGLAASAGIPPSTVKNIIYGVSQNTGIVTIKKICDGFGISLTDFFDTKVFRELEQEIK